MRARRTKTVRTLTFGPGTRRRAKQVIRFAAGAIGLALIGLTVGFVHTYHCYARLVDERLARGYLSSRAGIYAAPRTLRAGQKYTPGQLGQVLRQAGYIESDAASEVWNGSFSANTDSIDIRPNSNTIHSVIHVSFDAD